METKDFVAAVSEIKTAAENRFEEIGVKQRELADEIMGLKQRGTQHFDARPADPTDALAGKIRAGLAAVADGSAQTGGISLKSADLLGLQRKSTIVNAGTTMSEPSRLAGVVAAPHRRKWVRELMPVVPVASGSSAEFLRATNAAQLAGSQYDATPQTEGAIKKESSFTFELVQLPIPTIAHWTKASRQVLSDNAALSAFLEGELLHGLQLELERQILVGDGTSGDMGGLLKSGNYTAYADAVVGDTYIDALRRALGQLTAADHQADAIVLNPADWTTVELAKEDTTAAYIAGQPRGVNPSVLWGVPVFTSTAMTAGDFVVADLTGSVALHMREDARLLVSEADGTDFTKNVLTLLAELRAVLAVHRPGGVIVGSFA